jgi:hypothetical protein
MSDPSLAEELRRTIFLALVDAQDHGVPVPQSRQQVAARFDISEREMLDIEREGTEKEWPPLA